MPAPPADTAPGPAARRALAMDLAVDLGFAALLLVCGVRYFTRHELAGTGVLVLALAAGAGASYAVAVIGRGRTRDLDRIPEGIGSAGARQTIGLLAATGFWLPLAVIAPSFGWCAFALFFAVHRVLRGPVAIVCSAAIVVSVSVGLFLMSRGEDLGLVLGPFFGGLVLAYAYAALDRALGEQRHLIDELIDTREQLARTEREAGAAAERGRVASELHDTVVQRTASALLMLETDDLRPGGSSAPVAEARDTLREALVETRQLLHGLADPAATAASLAAALRAQADVAGAEFTVAGAERPVAEPVAHALQRIVQESLLNARKHAHATRTRVALVYAERTVGVRVSDDGRGIADGTATSDRPAGGFGLRAMAWRAESLGGSFSIESPPGKGTTIAAELPAAPETGSAAGRDGTAESAAAPAEGGPA